MTHLAIHRKLPAFKTVLAKTFSGNLVQVCFGFLFLFKFCMTNKGVGGGGSVEQF